MAPVSGFHLRVVIIKTPGSEIYFQAKPRSTGLLLLWLSKFGFQVVAEQNAEAPGAMTPEPVWPPLPLAVYPGKVIALFPLIKTLHLRHRVLWRY